MSRLGVVIKDNYTAEENNQLMELKEKLIRRDVPLKMHDRSFYYSFQYEIYFHYELNFLKYKFKL